MRIAYLSLHWPRTQSSGVGKKIHQHISLWREVGHEVHFFMHTHSHSATEELLDGSHYEYWRGQGPLGLLRTEFSRSLALQRMIRGIAAFQPDLIFLRWGMYAFPLQRLASIAPLVVEINTNDATQHRLLGKVYGYYNLLTRPILLRRAAGLVCASHELAQTPEFARYRKPTIVISNGYDFSGVQPFPAPQNETPRLVFMGTPGYPWHGVDKMVQFAGAFTDIQVDIVGYDSLPDQGLPPRNLHFLGYLQESDYLKVLAAADAAFGTLALHRKGMEEASPLKTRESLAYGLPLVLAYKDTDLDDLQCNFLLKIPNREDNMITHGSAVHDFACQVRGVRVDRSLIVPRLDARKKEHERLEFFKDLVRGSSGKK